MSKIIYDGNKQLIKEKYNKLIKDEKNLLKKIILILRKDLELKKPKETQSIY